MGDGYPLFEWYTGIEINETMANYKEENIMVGEEIPIKHEDNLENMEIWEGYEANDDVNKGKIIEDNEVGMRYTYITEEEESNEYEGKIKWLKKVIKWVTIVLTGWLMTLSV